MTAWTYTPAAWLDVWTSQDARCMITRHPRHDRGEYVVWVDGERVASDADRRFAFWKATNHLEGTTL